MSPQYDDVSGFVLDMISCLGVMLAKPSNFPPLGCEGCPHILMTSINATLYFDSGFVA